MKRVLLLVLAVTLELAGCYAGVRGCGCGRPGYYHHGGPGPGPGCGCGSG